MKYLILFLLPVVALAKPAAKPPTKTHSKVSMKKSAPKRVATKVTSGKQICQLVEKIAATGIPQQKDIDIPVSAKFTVSGKLGAIDKTIGTLHIGNLFFRATATAGEGLVYEEKCLKIAFPDLDNDGVKDLEVSVSIKNLDPKTNALAAGLQHYERTFIYHPLEKIYEPMSGSPNPFVELLIQ
jgi:hypothetical protein